jgi:hypothetical protein
VSQSLKDAAWWPWWSGTLALAGVAFWLSSISGIHPYAATETGLVSGLPAVWWIGLALLVVALASELCRQAPRTAPLVVITLGFALVLHGTLPASESTPRFDAAYSISLFTEILARTGRPEPLLDARMAWPALFSAAGMAARAMGVSAVSFLRWTPLVLNLCYLLPLKVIANVSLRTSRAQWLALPFFLAANWLDQDYFSPQGIDLFIYLVVIAILLKSFSAQGWQPAFIRRAMSSRSIQGGTRVFRSIALLPDGAVPAELSAETMSRAMSLSMYGLLLFFISAIVVSHQFTPIALCVVLFVLAMAGRTQMKALWLITAVLVSGWLSWQGSIYWIGHLKQVFGGVGQVGAVVNASVGARLEAVPSGRLLVQHARIAASVLTGLGAALGFWWSWRRGRTQWTLVILALAPVAVALATNYGGEVALRILLFSLAPAAVLIAGLVDVPSPSRLAIVACVLVGALLLALFPLTRYGNESFEAMSPGDVGAVNWVSDHVPVGSYLLVANSDNPFDSVYFESLHIEGLGGLAVLPTKTLRKELFDTVPNVWIFLDLSQEEYGIAMQGEPQGWELKLTERLLRTGVVEMKHRSSTAVVLKVVLPTDPAK